MRREEHRWFSGSLGHDMDLVVYGHAGKPLVCFPSKEGRTRDWESFGMVDCVADMIEQGKLMMFALDSVDWQSWTNQSEAESRARRHNDYHRYVVEEVMPSCAASRATTWPGRPAAPWAPSMRPTSSSASPTCSMA